MYDFAALDAALAATVFGGRLHFAAVTGSTSNDAMEAARKGAVHGTVYFADAQSAGRGRSDHRWESASGEGIYVSVVLRPQAPLDRWTLLPLCAGLAVIDAIRAVAGVDADLRWPNDVLVAGRKLCGILVEASTDEHGEKFAVAGIGINVHQCRFAEELHKSVTSLDLVTGRRIARQSLLIYLLQSLQREVAELADEGCAQRIPSRIEQVSTWLRDRRVRVHGPQACEGKTMGVDAHGFLRVATATGIVTVQTGGIRAAEME